MNLLYCYIFFESSEINYQEITICFARFKEYMICPISLVHKLLVIFEAFV